MGGGKSNAQIEGSTAGAQRKGGLLHKRNPFHSRMLGLKRTPSQHSEDSPVTSKGIGGGEEVSATPTSPTCVAQQLTTVPSAFSMPTSMPTKTDEINVGTASAEEVAKDSADTAVPKDEPKDDEGAILQAEADATILVAKVLASAEDEEALALGQAIVETAIEAAVEAAHREAAEFEMSCSDAAKAFTERVFALAIADITAEAKPAEAKLADAKPAAPARQTSDSVASVALLLAPKWRPHSGLWGKLRSFGPDLSSILRDATFERETAEDNPFRWE